jgi:8-oxo-dGTP pyrophosphatase MutT (NUDIX family)
MSDFYRRIRERLGSSLLLIPAVAALVRDREGRVLVHQRPDGSWSLPAGAVEPGETPARAIAREVREETGLVVRAERIAGVVGGLPCRVRYQNGDEVEFAVTVFDCSVVGGELLQTGEETVALAYVSASELPSRLAFPYPPSIFARTGEAAFFQQEGPLAPEPRGPSQRAGARGEDNGRS